MALGWSRPTPAGDVGSTLRSAAAMFCPLWPRGRCYLCLSTELQRPAREPFQPARIEEQQASRSPDSVADCRLICAAPKSHGERDRAELVVGGAETGLALRAEEDADGRTFDS
jgi:hypothetical protein